MILRDKKVTMAVTKMSLVDFLEDLDRNCNISEKIQDYKECIEILKEQPKRKIPRTGAERQQLWRDRKKNLLITSQSSSNSLDCICKENRYYSVNDIYDNLHKNKELKEVYQELYSHEIDKLLEAKTKYALVMTPDKDYIERIMEYKTSVLTDREQRLFNWMMTIFNNLKITKEIFKEMIDIMNLNNGKKNTIYMVGKPSIGKTRIANMLSSPFELSQEGTIGEDVDSKFWLSDTQHKQVYRCEEMTMLPENQERVKMLFEGNESLKTDIKFAAKSRIKKRPVIVTCNRDIWYKAPGIHVCIMPRILRLDWSNSPVIEFNQKDTTRLEYRHVLYFIYNKLC